MTTPGGGTGPASEVREELMRAGRNADKRGSHLLASLGAALTVLLGTIGSGIVTPQQYAVVPQLLLWVGCAACAPAVVLLRLAATPAHGNPRHLTTLSRTARTKSRRIRYALVWGTAFFALTLLGIITGMST